MTISYGAPLRVILLEVVRPALQMTGIWSEAREQLVLGTGAVESGYKYVMQIGGGPALGWWQCEPETFEDMLANYLAYRVELRDKLRRLCDGLEHRGTLIAYPQYAAALCGIHYLRSKPALPDPGDAQGMAYMHKAVYNTDLGKTDPTESVLHFQAAIEACR